MKSVAHQRSLARACRLAMPQAAAGEQQAMVVGAQQVATAVGEQAVVTPWGDDDL
jgi:hypothetical protein